MNVTFKYFFQITCDECDAAHATRHSKRSFPHTPICFSFFSFVNWILVIVDDDGLESCCHKSDRSVSSGCRWWVSISMRPLDLITGTRVFCIELLEEGISPRIPLVFSALIYWRWF